MGPVIAEGRALVLNSVPRVSSLGTTSVVLEQGFLQWHDKRRPGTVLCVAVQSNVFCVASAQQRGDSVTINAHSSSAALLVKHRDRHDFILTDPDVKLRRVK